MQIEVSTDSHIDGREKLTNYVQGHVETALERFSSRITRVEVHLTDESGKREGNEDTKCVMEVRMGGRPPVAVKSQERSVDSAITAATHKLKHLVESTLSRESSLAGHRDH
ncbi:MAG: HPF/RaiA family ribosome-associated protein [Pseudolabrys sp.]|nr:HPF/RaiA family ribosome-associated protein [Pseudolabrys sp.]